MRAGGGDLATVRRIYPVLMVLALLSCGRADRTPIGTITSDLDSHEDGDVRIEGARVSRDSNAIRPSSRLLDYIVMEDESGRMDVWYNTGQRRCPPRLGATLTAVGNVVDVGMMDTATGGTVTRQVFIAGSFSIDDEPPLVDDEVRFCQLPMAEQQMLALEGLERLEDFWSANGKRVRTVVYD